MTLSRKAFLEEMIISESVDKCIDDKDKGIYDTTAPTWIKEECINYIDKKFERTGRPY